MNTREAIEIFLEKDNPKSLNEQSPFGDNVLFSCLTDPRKIRNGVTSPLRAVDTASAPTGQWTRSVHRVSDANVKVGLHIIFTLYNISIRDIHHSFINAFSGRSI